MAQIDIDFEGTAQTGTSSNQQNNENQNNDSQEDVTSLNDNDNNDITGRDNSGTKPDEDNQNNTDNSSTGELSEGDTIEADGIIYTVDSNGNLVDPNGTIFKESKDVADWLKSVEVEDNNNSETDINIANIQESIGITVTDSEGNPIEFTNDAAGVKSYIESVIDLKSQELQEAAVNKVFQTNPLLKQFNDYVQLTGSPRGFGEIPDRSGIKLDQDNEDQLKAVIRMAAQEFGNKSLNENYIKYLTDSGSLYDEAKTQLQALIEKDKAVREDIRQKAEAQRQAEAEKVNNYWNKVNNVINSRIIAGYKLPESFTKEVNGQKVIFTPNDFYNYLSKATETDTDGNKVTGYQRDLNKLTEDEYLNRELLDAWLMFTGGSYKDLINMAVQEDKVRQLRVKSKENKATKTVRIIKKQADKANVNDIILS